MVSGGRRDSRGGGKWSCDEYIMIVLFFIVMLFWTDRRIIKYKCWFEVASIYVYMITC